MARRHKTPHPRILETFTAWTVLGPMQISIWHAPEMGRLGAETHDMLQWRVCSRDVFLSPHGIVAMRASQAGRSLRDAGAAAFADAPSRLSLD